MSILDSFRKSSKPMITVEDVYRKSDTVFRSFIVTFSFRTIDALLEDGLIELIAEAAGRKARLWRVPRPLVRFMARVGDCLRLPLDSERLGKLTGDSVVDNSAIKAALGWDRMPVRAEDGLRETLKWFSREAAGK